MNTLAFCLLLASQAWSAPKAPLVHGHRGCRAVLPENTIAAFDGALRAGADVLETDLNVTKDGVVVVSHEQSVDPDICRFKDGRPAEKVPIRSLTLAEVKAYDCGSIKNPKFPKQMASPGQPIPTLAELFAYVKASGYPNASKVEFNIETKIVPGEPDLSPSPEEFARQVVSVVRSAKMESRTIIQSFDRRTLEAVRKLEPKIRLSMLLSDNLPDLAAVAKAQKVHFISPHEPWITKEDVRLLHAAGVKVAPWTVNDEKGWERMLDLRVDAVITDDPGAFIMFLKKRGLR
ncbi:MAG: glycerophosphodiester phosphodiesterase [Elusimicrobiota bacterium]